IASGATGITGTLANTTSAGATGINLTNGTITTSGVQSLHVATLVAVGAGTVNGFLVTPPSTTTSGGTINGLNIGAITTSGGTDTAINVASGWDTGILLTGTTGLTTQN